MPGMDVEQLVAIDVHVHAERNTNEPQDPVTGEVLAAAARSFGGSPPQPTAQEIADHYREPNIAAVIFTVDDDSGWSPKYFPENLIRYTNGPLKHKMLFGSDYPLITPDRWLNDFAQPAIKDEVRPPVLKDNAARLLGLTT